MQASLIASMKAEDELFRRGAPKEDRVCRIGNLVQASDVAVKASMLVKSRREKSYVADLPDLHRHTIAVPYGRFNLQLGQGEQNARHDKVHHA